MTDLALNDLLLDHYASLGCNSGAIQDRLLCALKKQGSSRSLSVGANGRFSTIQDAIDFIDLQDDCFELIDGSHTDRTSLDPPTDSIFSGLWVSDWAIDSNIVTLGVGVVLNTFTKFSGEFWFGINSESRLYQTITNDDTGQVILDGKRIEASISGVTEDFSLYREKPYIIELLDESYSEEIFIDSNAVIIFNGRDTKWHGRIGRTENFKYGVIDFSGVVIANFDSANTNIMNNSSDGFDTDNTIALRIHNGSRVTAQFSDFMSPDVHLGSVKIENLSVKQSPKTGIAHLFFFNTRGSITLNTAHWDIIPAKVSNAIKADCFMFDGCRCRVLSILNLAITLDDPLNNVNSLNVIRGANFADYVTVQQVSFSTDSALSNLSVAGEFISIVSAKTNSTGTPVASPNINISDISLNAPNATAADLYAYRGEALEAATVSVTNIYGGKVFNAGLDVITFQTETTTEST